MSRPLYVHCLGASTFKAELQNDAGRKLFACLLSSKANGILHRLTAVLNTLENFFALKVYVSQEEY